MEKIFKIILNRYGETLGGFDQLSIRYFNFIMADPNLSARSAKTALICRQTAQDIMERENKEEKGFKGERISKIGKNTRLNYSKCGERTFNRGLIAKFGLLDVRSAFLAGFLAEDSEKYLPVRLFEKITIKRSDYDGMADHLKETLADIKKSDPIIFPFLCLAMESVLCQTLCRTPIEVKPTLKHLGESYDFRKISQNKEEIARVIAICREGEKFVEGQKDQKKQRWDGPETKVHLNDRFPNAQNMIQYAITAATKLNLKSKS